MGLMLVVTQRHHKLQKTWTLLADNYDQKSNETICLHTLATVINVYIFNFKQNTGEKRCKNVNVRAACELKKGHDTKQLLFSMILLSVHVLGNLC